MSILTVALDAMGGDFGPTETVPAAAQALSLLPNLKILLVGEQEQLLPLLEQYSLSEHPRLQLIHASQSVLMSDRPVIALRTKTDSSMRVMLELVCSEQAQACVSSGNTGALMVMAMRVLTMLPHLKRPALCSSLPNLHGQHTVMLDLGCNVNCSPEMLFQFACMGDLVSKHVHAISSPRIALLNVGAEVIKGSKLVQETAKLLASDTQFNYIGFLEGDQLISGLADVIVCDGFAGNIALKTAEGIARFFYHQMRGFNETLMTNKKTNSAAEMQTSLSVMHPDHYNGASLLGLNGIVIKSHGRAKRRALSNAILHAVAEIEQKLPRRISERFTAEHTYER
ncbi:phosphate acyltransferase PlsX [Tolumonas lignilytica]|uniref:phosphate acyltransferase PlsX n=1 Tax=Tolumonas lignilytica TaxID=1283284 RepID=UPI000463AA9C|nr:phosphate acyltransferase PlsX [Tolumonas lignilytica]